MKKSKYILITKSSDGETGKLYGNTLRNMKRLAKFIFDWCTPKSVCIVNMSGKVGFYKVSGAPEKTENRMAKEMI